jgi:hypothetical protein
LVANSCFAVIFYSLENYKIKREFKKQLSSGLLNNSQDLENFEFNEKEYSNLQFDEKFEFFLNEKKYDIVKHEIKNGIHKIKAIEDKQEKELFKKFAKTQKKRQLKQSNYNLFIEKTLSISLYIINELKISNSFYLKNIIFQSNLPTNPPPEWIVLS